MNLQQLNQLTSVPPLQRPPSAFELVATRGSEGIYLTLEDMNVEA